MWSLYDQKYEYFSKNRGHFRILERKIGGLPRTTGGGFETRFFNFFSKHADLQICAICAFYSNFKFERKSAMWPTEIILCALYRILLFWRICRFAYFRTLSVALEVRSFFNILRSHKIYSGVIFYTWKKFPLKYLK